MFHRMSALLFGLTFIILAFEIVSALELSFLLGRGYMLMAVSLAFLAQGAGSILLSALSTRIRSIRLDLAIAMVCSALGVTLAIAFWGIASVQDSLNAVVDRAAAGQIENAWTNGRQRYAPLLGLIVGLPHFVFAVGVNFLYLSVPEDRFRRCYLGELLGGAAGSVFAIYLLESRRFLSSVFMLLALPFGIALLLCICSRHSRGRILLGTGAIASIVLMFFLSAPEMFEPQANPDLLARNWSRRQTVREIFHGWNSNTRFGLLELSGEGSPRYIVSLNSGEGHARVPQYRPGMQLSQYKRMLGAIVGLFGVPKNVLVLLAGVGSDFHAIYPTTQGKAKLTGVELNGQMVDALLARTEFNLPQLFKDANAKMVITDARIFLTAADEKYSVILTSYSGAPSAQFMASFGATTQYLYTQEALERLFARLDPSGTLIILNGNKFNLIHGIRRVKAADPNFVPVNSIMVFYDPNKKNSWDEAIDPNVLIVRPSGFSSAEVKHAIETVREFGLQVAYAPGEPFELRFRPYSELLSTADFEGYVTSVSDTLHRRFGVSTDDCPFPLNQFRFRDYFSSGIIASLHSKLSTSSLSFSAEEYEVISLYLVIFLTLILCAAGLIFRSGPRKDYVKSGGYFFAVGAAFIILETALYHGAILYLGTPTLALAVSISGILLFAGLGCLASSIKIGSGPVRFRTLGALLAIFMLALHFIEPLVEDYVLGLSIVQRSLIVVLSFGPIAFVQGYFFPRGLALFNYGPPTLLWGRATNTAGTTLGLGLSVVISKTLGIVALSVLGFLCYLTAVIIAESVICQRRQTK